MKKYFMVLSVLALVLCTGCERKEQKEKKAVFSESTPAVSAEKVLIAYFSLAENMESQTEMDADTSASIQEWEGEWTGNAGVLARMIQKWMGGELFPILSERKYPTDLEETYNVGKQEQVEENYPDLAQHIENMEQYDTVVLVYPTWWNKMPMAVYSFFHEYDFAGKNLYIVNTSDGSGFMDEINEIKKLEPEAVVMEGVTVRQDDVLLSEDEVKEWVESVAIH